MLALSLALLALPLQDAAELPTEADFWRIETLEIPEGIVMEVSGIATLPDGRPLVCTRRGEVFVIDDPFGDDQEIKLFADGLQEPLGLLVADDGWIYTVQRGELSRFRDANGDDRLDELETFCDAWTISGNYHEYNFGPRRGPDGDLWITTNKPFGGEPFGRAKWRGFAVSIDENGEMTPICSGLRSPAGVEASPWGDMFYTDNQGEWCGASKLSHLVPGQFHGHPWGIFSCEEELWPYGDEPHPPSGVLMSRYAVERPDFQLPAVWFPYDKMGKSPSGFVWDDAGAFGPFAGQVFVGDQHHASVMRVFLEEVEGHWQGACFPFRYGFNCGVLRVAWDGAGGLLVGETNRGWASRGNRTFGLERMFWTGETPFEIQEMRARTDGFELVFTQPVDRESASDAEGYEFESYTYLLHSSYGSDEVDREYPRATEAVVSEDGYSVRLRVDGLRAGYVHEMRAPVVRSADGLPLLHDLAYYTLVEIPGRTEYMGRRIARTMHWTGAPWLLRETRQREENTALLLDALELEPGMRVCDLGSGNGYIAHRIAPEILPGGDVVCVEVQQEMLDMLDVRSKELSIENVAGHLGSYTNPWLEPDSLDLVMMVDVYHEFSHPEHMLRHVRDALAEGGRVALVEFRSEDPEVPIKPLHKMSKEQAVAEFEANGFVLSGEFDELPWQHLLFFEVAPRE